MLKNLFKFILIFFCISSYGQTYVCTPSDSKTQLTYLGKLFLLTIDTKCIKLRSLQHKSDSWHWKVTLTNSLGDVEGSRHFCDQKDDGWIGNPAVWRKSSKKLIVFQSDGPTGADVMSFDCQVNPVN